MEGVLSREERCCSANATGRREKKAGACATNEDGGEEDIYVTGMEKREQSKQPVGAGLVGGLAARRRSDSE